MVMNHTLFLSFKGPLIATAFTNGYHWRPSTGPPAPDDWWWCHEHLRAVLRISFSLFSTNITFIFHPFLRRPVWRAVTCPKIMLFDCTRGNTQGILYSTVFIWQVFPVCSLVVFCWMCLNVSYCTHAVTDGESWETRQECFSYWGS